jgi:hypothetical protein
VDVLPVNEILPQPVIELPGLAQSGADDRFQFDDADGKHRRKRRARN